MSFSGSWYSVVCCVGDESSTACHRFHIVVAKTAWGEGTQSDGELELLPSQLPLWWLSLPVKLAVLTSFARLSTSSHTVGRLSMIRKCPRSTFLGKAQRGTQTVHQLLVL